MSCPLFCFDFAAMLCHHVFGYVPVDARLSGDCGTMGCQFHASVGGNHHRAAL